MSENQSCGEERMHIAEHQIYVRRKCSGKATIRAVGRDFWNHENGPLNVNLNDDLGNRKLPRFLLGKLNGGLGARLRSSPDWSGHYDGGVCMNYQLLQKSYDLVKWIYPTVNKFPKSQRLILSQRIELLALSILTAAIKLNYVESKVIRKNAIIEIHKLQFLMRLSKDISFLSIKQYEYASVMLTEILKILGEREKVNENIQQFIQ